MQTAFRAGVRAFSTADTLRRTGNLPPGKGHRTSPFTSPAVNASLLVPLKLHQAEAVEPAINRPQWTQILTEGPEHLHRQQDNAQQNPPASRGTVPQPDLSASHSSPTKEGPPIECRRDRGICRRPVPWRIHRTKTWSQNTPAKSAPHISRISGPGVRANVFSF